MSRDKKKQINLYQINDCEAIARHLEKMAAKGWLLEKVGNWGWTFRRAEPCRVRYCITFFPEASLFDAGPTSGQETYFDYCQAAGWEFVAAMGPIQYFRSTQPDPVPIETDESAKLTAIHRTMKKTLLLSYGLLLLSQCLSLWSRWGSFQWSPMSTLSSPSTMCLVLLLIALSLYLVGNLADYFIWYFRSKRSVAEGGACLPVHTRARMWAGGVLLAVCALCVLAYVADFATSGWWLVLAYSFGGIALLYAVVYGVMGRMKRQGADRKDTRTTYLVLTFVLAFAYAFGMFPLAGILSDSGALDREPAYVYTSDYGREWNIYRDELPVTLEDLGFTVAEEDHCSYEAEVSSTPLARYAEYSQTGWGEDSELPWLRYQVCVIPWQWLRELCCGKLMEGSSYASYDPCVVPVSPAPEKAWCRDYGCLYIMLYSDRIVVISGGWEIEEWQMQRITEAMLAF